MSQHNQSLIGRVFGSVEFRLILAWLAVLIVTVLLDSNHTYWDQSKASSILILRNSVLLGLFALGSAVIIISGGIDLSSGSVIALSATIFGMVLMFVDPKGFESGSLSNFAVIVAMLSTLFVGVMIGTLHAWLITCVGLPPFVATLATLVGLRSLGRGLVLLSTAGKSQIEFPDQKWLETLTNLTYMTILFLVTATAIWLLMSRTVTGRHLHAMGGNEQAAKLSGIRTDRLKWLAYVLGAVTASLVGIIRIADEGAAKPDIMARGYELNAIAGSVIGGCSLQGGIGTVPGVVLGCLFLQTIIDAVSKVVGAGSNIYEGLIVGVVVVLAVTFSQSVDRAMLRKYFSNPIGWAVIPVLGILATLGFLLFCSDKVWFKPSYAIGFGIFITACLITRSVYELKISKAK